MSQGRGSAVDPAAWEESLLATDTEKLLSLVRHYLGPLRGGWDKRGLVSRLVSFLGRPETLESLLGLMDGLDAAIASTLLLAGPLEEGSLRALFRGEVRAFDLDVRLANLEDRLLLFRLRDLRGSRLALNPLLAEALGPAAGDPRLVFASAPAAEGALPPPSPAARGGGELSPLLGAIGLFAFLFHSPGALRKDGSLSKKAQQRLAEVLPDSAARPDRYRALLASFAAAGFLVREELENGYEADAAAFDAALAEGGEGLPLDLALALGGLPRRPGLADLLSRALRALPRDLPLPERGLARWLGIAALREGIEIEAEEVASALARLGLIERRGEAFILPAEEEAKPEILPALVADGAHLLRVLPEAGAAARWFAVRIARPLRLGLVWELELDRETLREAFASGLRAREIVAELARLSGRPLPQSLVFSLESWEGEFLSARLYQGWVLVCDERKRAIFEGRPDLASLVVERFAPGVYLLDAGDGAALQARLSAVGIEVPPPIRGHGGARGRGGEPPRSAAPEEGGAPEAGRPSRRKAAPGPEAAAGTSGAAGGEAGSPRLFDPEPRLAALRAALEERLASAAEAPERERLKELADRLESRLLLDPAQLDRADVNAVRLEATGLDYGGKVRLAERAIASPGDRLEIRYLLPGGDPETVVLRPVRLQKTERGLVLEGEDLAAGSPVRVPLGAASMVRRLRATPFGDER